MLTKPRYLCETYDKYHTLIPSSATDRIKVQQWVHAAEATFALHALAILYARRNIPADASAGVLEAAEAGMAANVRNDFAWLEKELGASTGRFLVGDRVTAADVMMQFSVAFILKRGLGVKEGEEGERVRKWMEACEGSEGYRRAVERTGHRL